VLDLRTMIALHLQVPPTYWMPPMMNGRITSGTVYEDAGECFFHSFFLARRRACKSSILGGGVNKQTSSTLAVLLSITDKTLVQIFYYDETQCHYPDWRRK